MVRGQFSFFFDQIGKFVIEICNWNGWENEKGAIFWLLDLSHQLNCRLLEKNLSLDKISVFRRCSSNFCPEWNVPPDRKNRSILEIGVCCFYSTQEESDSKLCLSSPRHIARANMIIYSFQKNDIDLSVPNWTLSLASFLSFFLVLEQIHLTQE